MVLLHHHRIRCLGRVHDTLPLPHSWQKAAQSQQIHVATQSRRDAVLVSAVPSAVMYTDMQCQTTVQTGSGQGIMCSIQRGSVHFLQSCYYLLTSLLVELTMKMTSVRASQQKSIGKFMHIASYVMPTICLICTYSLSSVATRYPPAYYELWGWNYLKDPFRCTVQLQTTMQEWVFVHGHFVVLGFVIVGLCSWIIKQVLTASVKANQSSKDKIKEWILMGMYRQLTKAQMTKLLAVCTQVTIVIAMQLAVSIELNRVLGDFSINLDEWRICSYLANSLRGVLRLCHCLCIFVFCLCLCIVKTHMYLFDGIDSLRCMMHMHPPAPPPPLSLRIGSRM
jgi:hypothetical protein